MAPGDMAKTRCFTSGYPDESRIQGTHTWIPTGSLGIILSSPVGPPDKCWVKWMSNGNAVWIYMPYLEVVR